MFLQAQDGMQIAAAETQSAPLPVGTLKERLPQLVAYWRIVHRRRWIIGAIVGVAVALGILLTLLMTPLYTATATLEIARQQDKIVNVEDVRQESTAVDQEFYQTQYALLKSRSLAERVATTLKLSDDPNFVKQKSSWYGSFFNKQAAALSAANEKKERQRQAVDSLLASIVIAPNRGSRLVNVSYTSADPALSARIANAWTESFIATNLERRFDSSSYARTFLEGRLANLRTRLEQSERELVGYAISQKIINVTTTEGGNGKERQERPIIVDDLIALNASFAEATADRIRAQSRLNAAGPRGTSTEALTNPTIATLRQKRAEVAADYSKLLVQFEPGYPMARALSQQLGQLDAAIQREETRITQGARVAYDEASKREAALASKVDQLKSDLLNLRGRSIQYNIYQREVDTNRTLYDGLLQRYKEIGVAAGVGTNNISIVDGARVPERPSQPSLPINLALALLFGLALATLAVVTLEQVDEALQDPAQAAEATGLPVLGAIPIVDTDDPVKSIADRKSVLSEAYLSVQTNLQFSTNQGVPRSLAVTSTRPNEGKSTTSFSIALLLARTERRVLLIDGDMRAPSIHALAGFVNGRGLSDLLAGDEDIDGAVRSLGDSTLKVLTAGAQPPNAGELLTGDRFEILLNRMLEKYDHVVIDCPPVVGLADAPLIASRVAGTIYVIEAHGVRASVVRVAIARLASANVRILGLVLNKFSQKRADYGYGYEYGYGYGQS